MILVPLHFSPRGNGGVGKYRAPRLPLGEDLVAGHVHPWVPADTVGSSHSPRAKRRIRAKTSLAELERREGDVDPAFWKYQGSEHWERTQQMYLSPKDRWPQQTLPQGASGIHREHIRIHQSVQQLEVHHLNY